MGLINPLVHVGADQGDAVGPAGMDGPAAAAAGDAIGHAHSGHVVHPAAAGIDIDVPGIGVAGQGLAQQRVPFLQLGDQERAAGGNPRRVHRGDAAGRGPAGQPRRKHTGVKSTYVLKLIHCLLLLYALCIVRMRSSATPSASAGPAH